MRGSIAALLMLAPLAVAAAPLQVDAPASLRVLLAEHLDLAVALAAKEAPNELERQRLCRLAPAQAQALAETEGYFASEAQVDCAAGRLVLKSGPRSKVIELGLTGPEEADPRWAAWRAAFALQPGMGFRQGDWDEAKRALLAKVRAQGHALARWGLTQAIVDGESVRLQLLLEPGPRIRLGEVRIEGLQRHRPEELRELLDLQPGQPYAEALLLDAQQRLLRSGLFDGVWVELDGEELQDGERLPVKVRVKESSAQQLALGLGWQSQAGGRLSVEHLHRRPFGLALRARSRIDWGQEAQKAEFELSTHPGHQQRRWLGALRWQRSESTDTAPFRLAGLRLGQVLETPRHDRSLGAELLSSRQGVGTQAARSEALLAEAGATWRRLDSVSLPRQGWLLGAQAGLGPARSRSQDGRASGALGRLLMRAQLYQPMAEGRALSLRVEAGQLWAPAALLPPEVLAFRAGGDDSVRGYAPRSLGPLRQGLPVGGRVLWTASVEGQQPLPARWFGGLAGFGAALFVDGGQAAPSWQQAGKAAVGVGAGLRWRSPVGLLRVDLARAMTDQPQQRAGSWRLHLSVGIAL